MESFRQKIDGRIINSALKSVDIKVTDSTVEYVATEIAEGKKVILCSNHQGHFDGILMALIGKRITDTANNKIITGIYQRSDEFPGFVMPIAISALNGGQSDEVTDSVKGALTWFTNHKTFLRTVVREEDKTMYLNEEQVTDGPEINDNTKQTYEDILKKGYGLSLLISGTVDEGRFVDPQTENGPRKGMKMIKGSKFLSHVLCILHNLKEDAIILPIAFNGTYNFLDPNTRKIANVAMQNAIRNLNPLLKPKMLASAFALPPISTESIWQLWEKWRSEQQIPVGTERMVLHSFLNNSVLSVIAKQLPPEARGEFC